MESWELNEVERQVFQVDFKSLFWVLIALTAFFRSRDLLFMLCKIMDYKKECENNKESQ
ncbi:hypothetical protein Scep_016949 [Stephania cephalantha]|uniref:Uncharacterized protein n=1 Tax=Stephania cephalantha TaxID=152367 RepID=A0AAP0NWF6_9MAGN